MTASSLDLWSTMLGKTVPIFTVPKQLTFLPGFCITLRAFFQKSQNQKLEVWKNWCFTGFRFLVSFPKNVSWNMSWHHAYEKLPTKHAWEECTLAFRNRVVDSYSCLASPPFNLFGPQTQFVCAYFGDTVGYTEEARTCEAWFQWTFRPQKWNLKAHMWYQLSPFPSSNAAIAMQHHPCNIHQSVATPRYSATPWYVLIQLPNVIDTISKRWRSKKAFNTSPSHIFP